ncbi:hypothetical protein HHK36_017581 [Tetracentron sinense]|uniref:Uncharacterized protein n=1 Tax=Tetracentron sinense TaxID=13715 RepID=A0A834YYE9_TETSI|nr:hypothetical protein HHK36_017581 [Tetracentron sinense]
MKLRCSLRSDRSEHLEIRVFPLAMEGALAGASLSKHLASCNKTTRDKALRLLKTWLPSQDQISDEEMKKIWKGLFYCVWHADKQPVQIELINRLASLLVSLSLPLSIQYFDGFLSTMRREWSGIDFLRLDKFYLLIRRFLHHFFLLLKMNSWDSELSSRLMGVLVEKTFLAADKYPAQGVNYHFAEVFLEELKPFLPIKVETTLDGLFKPFLSVMGKSPDRVFLNKIKSSIFDCLLNNGNKLLELKKVGDYVDSGDGVEVLGSIALTLGLSAKFFNLGSSLDCLQGNRKVLFNLHEDFLKLEKDLETAGIEISVTQVGDEDADEVPDLIPIPEQEVGAAEVSLEPVEGVKGVAKGSAGKLSKKSKKTKKEANGTGKKARKNKNGFPELLVLESNSTVKDKNESVITSNGENSNEPAENNGNLIIFNESVISNLQMQFEKVAAEVGMDMDGASSCVLPTMPVNSTVSKKRKRAKSKDVQVSHGSQGATGGSATGKSGEKSAKKVRFSMKNNLVWKPHSPLPPQSLRLPPSATPRGSALKKGIPPGPIRETPPTARKVKPRASSVKKGRKGPKGVSPAIKPCFEEVVLGSSVTTEVPPIGGKEDSLETILVAKPKFSAEKIIYSPISGRSLHFKDPGSIMMSKSILIPKSDMEPSEKLRSLEVEPSGKFATDLCGPVSRSPVPLGWP